MEKGPLFRLSNSMWVKRRSAREARDAALGEIRADLIAAVEASLSHAAATATAKMMSSLGKVEGGVGPWLAGQRDPRDARIVRERRAADAARTWLDTCASLANELSGADGGRAVVGDVGLGLTLASAAVGVDKAAGALAVLARETGAAARLRRRGSVGGREALCHQQRGARHDEADRHRVAESRGLVQGAPAPGGAESTPVSPTFNELPPRTETSRLRTGSSVAGFDGMGIGGYRSSVRNEVSRTIRGATSGSSWVSTTPWSRLRAVLARGSRAFSTRWWAPSLRCRGVKADDVRRRVGLVGAGPRAPRLVRCRPRRAGLIWDQPRHGRRRLA